MSEEKLKKEAKQWSAFVTDVATAMKKHRVDNMVCIFGMNGKIRNTYLPLGDKGEEKLYCDISDAFAEWLGQFYPKAETKTPSTP